MFDKLKRVEPAELCLGETPPVEHGTCHGRAAVTAENCSTATSVLEMTRANSCCHEAQVRVGCRGRHCRSRRSKSANALAAPRRGREGRPYPVEIRENRGLFHRPMNWPVWSSVASIRKRLIPFVLLLVAAGCRQAP